MSPLWLAVLVLGLAGLALVSYALRALDVPGAFASFLLGLAVALVGGVGWVALMVLFSALGVVATRVGYARKAERRAAEAAGGERGVRNVIANGAAPALAAFSVPLAPWIPPEAAVLAFATAVAAVTADTLASEVGTLARGARRILPPFRRVPVGENGAVSLLGQAAALAGALAIALAAVPLLGMGREWVWLVVLGGFAGCQLDSVLGATLERDLFREGPLSKQDVNFIASAVPAFIVLVAVTLAT